MSVLLSDKNTHVISHEIKNEKGETLVSSVRTYSGAVSVGETYLIERAIDAAIGELYANASK